MQLRFQKPLHLGLFRRAQPVVAKAVEDRSHGTHRLHWPSQQFLVAHESPRQVRGRSQGPDVVRLPQRHADLDRYPVARMQRVGDFEWIAADVYADGHFQHVSPDRKQGAQARFLHEPGAVGVETHHDVRGQSRVFGPLLPGQRIQIQRREAVPVASRIEQDRVVQGAHVAPLPKALFVLRTAAGTDLFAAEVESHQVEHAGHRGGTGSVHSQHECLH